MREDWFDRLMEPFDPLREVSNAHDSVPNSASGSQSNVDESEEIKASSAKVAKAPITPSRDEVEHHMRRTSRSDDGAPTAPGGNPKGSRTKGQRERVEKSPRWRSTTLSCTRRKRSMRKRECRY